MNENLLPACLKRNAAERLSSRQPDWASFPVAKWWTEKGRISNKTSGHMNIPECTHVTIKNLTTQHVCAIHNKKRILDVISGIIWNIK
jgi:hypothetical protein